MPIILIVDDRPVNRAIYSKLASTLGQADTEIVEKSSPLDAIDWLGKNMPDLVITDFRMPGMDGAQLTTWIRSYAMVPDVPVIVLTAYDEADYSRQALDAGATEFLRTPVDKIEFRMRVENVFRMHRQTKELKRHAEDLKRSLEKSFEELKASEEVRATIVRDSREALTQVIDTVQVLISATDGEGRYTFRNALHVKVYGADDQSLLEAPALDPESAERAEWNLRRDRLVFTTGVSLPPYEETVRDAAGQMLVLSTSKTRMLDTAGEVVAVLTTSHDVTARKRFENELRHIAHHDALTGLPNRLALTARVAEVVKKCVRSEHMFAVHFIDLDRFKAVNDSLGHMQGDEILRQVAGRLSASVRQTDTVARLSGDEFAVLQSPVTSELEVMAFARRIVESLRAVYKLAERNVDLSGSVGSSVFPRDGRTYNELVNNADLAMYSVKLESRGEHRMFAASMTETVGWRLRMLDDLRRAIATDEFHLVYQPQVDLRTGEIVAVEALVRWAREDGVDTPPAEFLQIAEENSLMSMIDAIVMQKACAQGAEWARQGVPALRMCVNVSPSSFDVTDIAELVDRALKSTGLPAAQLEIEMTEQTLARNTDGALATIKKLKALGLQLAIDDFGIGYSSMESLKRFPIDRLKIDRSFIADVTSDPKAARIVRTIISLGQTLDRGVIAEGVETLDQLEFLVGEGCYDVQGYYYSRPLSPDRISDLVRAGFTPFGGS